MLRLKSIKLSSSVRLRKKEHNTLSEEATPFIKINLCPESGIIYLFDYELNSTIITALPNMIYGEVDHGYIEASKRAEETNKETTRGQPDRPELPKASNRNKRSSKI